MEDANYDYKDELLSAIQELLPAMEADGGGLELISIDESKVTLKLIGTCSYCPSRKLSADALKADLLKRVPHLKCVQIDFPKMARGVASVT